MNISTTLRHLVLQEVLVEEVLVACLLNSLVLEVDTVTDSGAHSNFLKLFQDADVVVILM